MHATIIFKVDIPEVIVICGLEQGILVDRIVKVPIIHQELLSLINAKVCRNLFVMKGTSDTIKCSQVILCHCLLVFALR